MVGVLEARTKQVECVGSQALLRRLSDKLARLELDKYFLIQQIKLFKWRRRFLVDNLGNKSEEEYAFLSTQYFDEILEELESHTEKIKLPYWIDGDPRPHKATTMFYAPWLLGSLFISLHFKHPDGQCHCQSTNYLRGCECPMCFSKIYRIKEIIINNPGVADTFEQSLHSIALHECKMKSLKDRHEKTNGSMHYQIYFIKGL